MRMTRWLGLAALVVVAGCEPPLSTNPLSDPAAATPDPRLRGTFVANLDGTEAWLHFNPREKGAVVDVVLVGNDRKDGAMVLHYEAFPTQLGGHGYLNLRSKTFPDMLESKYVASTQYLFARYDFAKDGSVTLAVMDSTPARQAIEKEQIAGTFHKEGDGIPTLDPAATFLHAETRELAAWVEKADPKLFHVLGTFQKVDPKLAKKAAK